MVYVLMALRSSIIALRSPSTISAKKVAAGIHWGLMLRIATLSKGGWFLMMYLGNTD